MTTRSILLAVTDPQILVDITQALGAEWETASVATEADALAQFEKRSFDALVVDFNLGSPDASELLNQALEIAGDPTNEKNTWHLLKGQTPRSYRIDLLGNVHAAFEYLYGHTGNYGKQITEAYEGMRLFESVKDTLSQAYTYTDIGNAYFKLNKFDSALYFEHKALSYYSVIG